MRGLLDPAHAGGDGRRPRPGPRRRRRAAGSGGQSADAVGRDLRARRARSGRAGARRRGAPRRADAATRARSARRSAPPPPPTPPNRPPRSSPTAPRAAPITSTAASATNSRSRSSRRASWSCSRGRLYRRRAASASQVHVLYRRTDEDRLSDARGRAHRPRRAAAAGAAVGPAALRQRLRHRRRRRQARPRLRRGDGPLLPRRGAAAALGAELRPRRRDGAREVLERLDELVLKPRDGFGGDGVTIMRRATERSGGRRSACCGGAPERFIAQETVPLSTHPTVCGARLRPRHVDLRPFVVSPPDGARGDARRPHPLRARGRRNGRQQLPRRRRQRHLGDRPGRRTAA